jgi:hypothetical protein
MKQLKFKLTFLNWDKKKFLDVDVNSTYTDAIIHEQGYLKLIDTGFPNIDWLTLLAEKKLNLKLNEYNLHSYDIINKQKNQ